MKIFQTEPSKSLEQTIITFDWFDSLLIENSVTNYILKGKLLTNVKKGARK
jgi:hypothetical protein